MLGEAFVLNVIYNTNIDDDISFSKFPIINLTEMYTQEFQKDKNMVYIVGVNQSFPTTV